jgi:hypothetical protein
MNLDTDSWLRQPVIVGAFGSLVGLKFSPGTTWLERGFNLLCGALCAAFLAPAATMWLHASGALENALAFAVGLFGLNLAAAIVQGLRDVKLGEIVSGWISRKG